VSNLPGVYGSRQDGGLRIPAASVDGLCLKMGPATSGAYNTVFKKTAADDLKAEFTGGSLVKSGAVILEKVSPQLFLRMKTSVAGGYVAPTQIHAAFAATVANGAVAGMVTPEADTSLDYVFTGASVWDGGDLSVVGQDTSGSAQTETVTQAVIQALGAGARTYRGTKVFKGEVALTLSKSATGADAGTCTIVRGRKTAAVTGSDSSISVSGSPLERLDLRIKTTRDGNVAGPTVPTIQISLDGGDNYTGDIALPVGGVYAFPVGWGTGLTLTVIGAAVKSGDAFQLETFEPTWNNSDLSEALAAANACSFDYEAIHIIGPCDAVLAATVSSYITAGENQSSPKWPFVVIEARDQATTIGTPPAPESISAWINVLSGASPGFRDYVDYRVSGCAGFAEILEPTTGRIQRRSIAWPYVTRLMEISPGTSPAETALGPLSGVYSIYHDEDKREALDAARFTTMRTYGRRSGFWITLGRLFYPIGSDFRKIQSLRVVNKAMRLVYDALFEYIEKKVKISRDTGKILESYARSIELPIVTLLTDNLKDAKGDPDITEPRVRINRDTNILTDPRLLAKVGIVPVGYAERVEFTIGLLNPAFEVVA